MSVRRVAWLGIVLASSAGCASLGYYSHVTHGQLSLLAARERIADLVGDPATDPVLRERLAGAQAARDFASDRLRLPRNRSYTSYVALDRPYATWNVFATPEFSVEPVTHCMPFAGCVPYLGFFDRARAEAAAARLAADRNDTAIVGSAAYSTLGWFADPVLSSMLHWDDDELDGVIFHELAHQQVYVKGDAAFNESWASFVQEQGVREWRAARGIAVVDASARGGNDRAFVNLVIELRERLRVLYASGSDAPAMRTAKAQAIAAFRARYRYLRDSEWAGEASRDRWVEAPLGNADLLPFGLYDRWKDAFGRVFRAGGSDWASYLACVAELAHLPPAARGARLEALDAAGNEESARQAAAAACPRSWALSARLRAAE
jgi:predicted aminopeptidase